jgi:hypothetical protein
MVSGEISLTKQRPRDARGLGVRLRGFEPPTPGSGIQCSIQLSYRRLGQETSADFSEALQRRYYRTKPGRKSSWRLRPAHLLPCQLRRNQICLNSVGVNPVIDLGQVALHVPAQLRLVSLLQTLELLDQIEFELDRYP